MSLNVKEKETLYRVLVKKSGPIFNKRCKYALFAPFSYTCKSDKIGELQTLFLMLPDEPQKMIISKIMNIDTTKVSSKNVVAFAGQIEQIRKLRNIVNHYEPVLPFLMSEIKTKKIEQSQLFTTLEILFKISPIVDIKPDEIQAKINPSNAKIIRILNVMYKSILS